MDFLEFEVKVGGNQPDYAVSVLRSPAGEASASTRLPLDDSSFKQYLQVIEGARSGTSQPRGISVHLNPAQPLRHR
jgi:hypothetical protein